MSEQEHQNDKTQSCVPQQQGEQIPPDNIGGEIEIQGVKIPRQHLRGPEDQPSLFSPPTVKEFQDENVKD